MNLVELFSDPEKWCFDNANLIRIWNLQPKNAMILSNNYTKKVKELCYKHPNLPSSLCFFFLESQYGALVVETQQNKEKYIEVAIQIQAIVTTQNLKLLCSCLQYCNDSQLDKLRELIRVERTPAQNYIKHWIKA